MLFRFVKTFLDVKRSVSSLSLERAPQDLEKVKGQSVAENNREGKSVKSTAPSFLRFLGSCFLGKFLGLRRDNLNLEILPIVEHQSEFELKAQFCSALTQFLGSDAPYCTT